MQNVDVEGGVLPHPLVVERTVGSLDAEEELQEKYRREDAADVHFKGGILVSEETVLHDLQEEAPNAEDEVDVLVKALFMEVEFRQSEAEGEVRKPEEPSVARVANGHIGVLEEIHISREEEVNGVAGGNDYLIIMELIEAHESVMQKRHHEKRNKEPQLCAGVGDGTVEEEKFQKKILVEQRGEVISDAVPLNIAADEVENNIEPEAEEHIMQRPLYECDRLRLQPLAVIGVAEISADDEKHRHGEPVKRKMPVALPRKMNSYNKKRKKDLEKIEIHVSPPRNARHITPSF